MQRGSNPVWTTWGKNKLSIAACLFLEEHLEAANIQQRLLGSSQLRVSCQMPATVACTETLDIPRHAIETDTDAAPMVHFRKDHVSSDVTFAPTC